MDTTPSSVYILAMPNSALDILKDVFGYDTFRGRQAEIIAHVAGGGDTLSAAGKPRSLRTLPAAATVSC